MSTEAEFNIVSDASQRYSWAIYKDVLVTFSLPGDVPADRWKLFVDSMANRNLKFAIGSTNGRSTMDSLQRKQAATVFGGLVRVAVLVDDRVTRGVITALGWLGMNIKAFTWDEAKDAIKYLDTPYPAEKLLDVLQTLRDRALSVPEKKQ